MSKFLVDSRLKVIWLISSLFLAGINHLVTLICISMILILTYILNGSGFKQDLPAFSSLILYLLVIVGFGLLEGYSAIWGAIIIGLKFVVLALTGIIFFRTTTELEILGSLTRFRLPMPIVLSIAVGFMSIPIVKKEAHHVLDAQSARGLTLKPRRKAVFNILDILRALVIPLLIRTFDRIFKLYVSLRLKSRGSGITLPKNIQSGSKIGNISCVIYIIFTLVAGIIL